MEAMYSCLNLVRKIPLSRATIRPPFGGHVLLFDKKLSVLLKRSKMPKCPPFYILKKKVSMKTKFFIFFVKK